MWKHVFLLALLAGCGGKKTRDCDAYAAKVAELSDPVPEQRDMVLRVSRDACTNGRVPDAELQCAAKATNRAELIACTVGSAGSAPPPPAPVPSNKITLLGAVNGGDFKPLDPDANADQRAWLDELTKSIAACAGDQKHEPREVVFVVTFGGGPPAVTPPGGLPPELASCITVLLSKPPPASVKNGPVEFYIGLGK